MNALEKMVKERGYEACKICLQQKKDGEWDKTAPYYHKEIYGIFYKKEDVRTALLKYAKRLEKGYDEPINLWGEGVDYAFRLVATEIQKVAKK